MKSEFTQVKPVLFDKKTVAKTVSYMCRFRKRSPVALETISTMVGQQVPKETSPAKKEEAVTVATKGAFSVITEECGDCPKLHPKDSAIVAAKNYNLSKFFAGAILSAIGILFGIYEAFVPSLNGLSAFAANSCIGVFGAALEIWLFTKYIGNAEKARAAFEKFASKMNKQVSSAVEKVLSQK